MKVLIAVWALLQAAPAPRSSNVTIEPFFYPQTVQEIFITNPNELEQTEEQAVLYGKEKLLNILQIQDEELLVTQSHRHRGITHLYCLHVVNGTTVDNHSASIHIKDGQVLSYTTSFTGNATLDVLRDQKFTAQEAEQIAMKEFKSARDKVPAKTVILEIDHGKLTYAHQFQLRNDATNQWLQISVDKITGDIIQIVNYVKRASYKVIKLPKANPSEGFEVVTDPANYEASPSGWHDIRGITKGNNVISRIYSYWKSYFTRGDLNLNFATDWRVEVAQTAMAAKDAAIVNSFYGSI